MISFGGNLVQTIKTPIGSSLDFAKNPYFYSYVKILKDETVEFSHLQSVCIYLLSGNVEVQSEKYVKELSEHGDTLQIENNKNKITGRSFESFLLVAGTREPHYETAQINAYSLSQLKRVNKPWGFELWITGEHRGYCLKKIFIKKNTKTSLQYHNIKRETNVLFHGQARLYFKSKTNILNDDVTADDLAFCELNSVSSIDIFPQTLHRLEAVTDITLYEVSTPELDDVIRVSDDTSRLNGRIQNEHKNNES